MLLFVGMSKWRFEEGMSGYLLMLLYRSIFGWREYIYALALVQLLFSSPNSLRLLLCIAQKAMPTTKRGSMPLPKSHKQQLDTSPLLLLALSEGVEG
jgi:hypothetical protein